MKRKIPVVIAVLISLGLSALLVSCGTKEGNHQTEQDSVTETGADSETGKTSEPEESTPLGIPALRHRR